MTEVHIIDRHNRLLNEHQLLEYKRLRHKIFVDERGWSGLKREDKIERDEYDNEHAICLIAIDRGQVVGGLRLYPTLRPHMMTEIFSGLASRGVPRCASILECTRYFVIRERRTGRTDCRLLAALQEYCLEQGIKAVTAVVEMWWLPRWQQIGFKAKPLGLPTLIENEPCLAAEIEISQHSLDRVRQVAGLQQASLVRTFDTNRHRVPHVAA